MFRLATKLSAAGARNNLSCNNLQFVRWAKRHARKPLGSPPAKSKLFRVPTRPVIPEDENRELQRLTNNYRTQMKSLKTYLTSNYTTDVTDVADEKQRLAEFEEDFARCAKINEEWSKKVGAERKEFFENDLMEQIETAQQRLKMKQETQRQKLEEAEKTVREVKEQAKTFIIPENIDEAIEYALMNPVDYNYSIDTEGNYYYGRRTKPNIEQRQTKEEISAKQ